MSSSLTIYGIKVFSNDVNIQKQLVIITLSPKFTNFIYNLDQSLLDVQSIRIDAVKWFCNPKIPDPDKLGFLYMEMSATDRRNGKPVPGVIFLRGDSVAVYIRIIVEDKKYVVLTRQIRGPYGKIFDEIPAGMMDACRCFSGVAIKEIQEETGLIAPSINCLKELGEPIVPSAGGCDEKIRLYFWETSIEPEHMEEMKSKIFGAVDENESIQLVFIPVENYEEHLITMGDVKAICAHQRAQQMGLLNETNVNIGKCCSIC